MENTEHVKTLKNTEKHRNKEKYGKTLKNMENTRRTEERKCRVHFMALASQHRFPRKLHSNGLTSLTRTCWYRYCWPPCCGGPTELTAGRPLCPAPLSRIVPPQGDLISGNRHQHLPRGRLHSVNSKVPWTGQFYGFTFNHIIFRSHLN